jgi:hypothetical protein
VCDVMPAETPLCSTGLVCKLSVSVQKVERASGRRGLGCTAVSLPPGLLFSHIYNMPGLDIKARLWVFNHAQLLLYR